MKHENLHLTLKFLGNTPEDLLPKIRDSLLNIVLYYEPFYIKIYGTGVFPNRRHPRVVWVEAVDSEILGKLKVDIEESMELLGYQREDKEFRSHLTLGRVRSQKGMVNLVSELDNFQAKEFGSISVNSLRLMKSVLKPGGAEYSCLYDITLGKKSQPLFIPPHQGGN